MVNTYNPNFAAIDKAAEGHFKKQDYFIFCRGNEKGKFEARLIHGYVTMIDGISVGVCKDGAQWVVTDLESGMRLCNSYTRKKAVTFATLCTKDLHKAKASDTFSAAVERFEKAEKIIMEV